MVSTSTTIQKEQKKNYWESPKPLYQSTRTLFAVALLGQLIFVYYILVFYGAIAWNGNYEKVNEELGHGVIAGDSIGNFMLGMHIFLAVVITLGGPIQFIPAIRRRFPVFHRWNGRIYYLTAFLICIAGLYMNFTRGAHGGIWGALGNGLNATLILSFSVLAWRTAMKRDFNAHKKWALRAFLMVSGVWFFRVGYGLWVLLSGFTAVGATPDLTGPFDRFLMFGHSLVPLLVIEFYFYVKRNPSARLHKMATGVFAVLSILLAAGIGMITMIFWAPHF